MVISEQVIDRLSKIYDLPDFVKTASIKEEFMQPITYDKYADPVNKRYPCHTKSATYFSNALFWDSSLFDQKASSSVGTSLLKFAEFWGILPDVKKNILEKAAKDATVKSYDELPDSDFAIVTNQNDKKYRLYPLIDAETVKLAADSLYENRYKFTYVQRYEGANKILEKAASENVELDDTLSDYLERAAGKGLTTTKTLVDVIEKRAYFYAGNKQTKYANALRKLAEHIKTKPTSKTLCQKTAEALDTLDVESGLYAHREKQALALPEEECHAILYKTACEFLAAHVTLPTGTTYLKEDLAKLGYDIASLYPAEKNKLKLNNSFSMDKAASWLENLPMDKARLVDTYFKAKSVNPTYTGIDLSLFRQ
jgi:hypothetical protein